MPAKKTSENQQHVLKGWQEIAAFLGQPSTLAQRWAKSGMPVEKRGRFVYSSREELNSWLGRESMGKPVQIPADNSDLSAELKRGLAIVRKQRQKDVKKRAA
jgi:hypothetical protein